MRITRAQPTLFSLLTILLTSTHPSRAKPYPRAADPGDLASVALIKRCANPCGYYSQLCCGQGQACLTDANNQPTCGGATAAGPAATTSYGQATATAEATAQAQTGGQWMYITTTITETDFVTRVSTYSTYVVGPTAQAVPTSTYVPAPAPTQGLSCDTSQGQTACGSICCASGQFCAIAGQCEAGGYASGGYNSGGYSSGGYSSGEYSSASTFSAPLRPTSGTGTTITGGPASTVPFQTPVGTAGGVNFGGTTTSNNGLSGGAIAGIVIGVIAGIILLILLCAACCFRAGFDGLRDLFGIGRRRRVRSETRVEERYSRHGSGSGGRHGGWFGSRPARVDGPPPRRSSGLGGLGAVTAGLAGLAIALGLKRRRDRNEKSNSGSSYSYSDSYYDTSESE